MNISYNWLKDYINIDLPVEETAKILTSIGLEVGEVEKVQAIKGGLEGLVVGEVLTCEKHENSDHLSVTTVNLGNDETVQIVCGAPNVAAGQKVIVATVGTTLYADDKEFKIKRAKIRGVESRGMICAEDEIGVGTSHEGIIVLPEDTKVGLEAKEYYGLEDDYNIEIDLTPNRIDAASHYGVARDLAAYFHSNGRTDIKLNKPSVADFKVDNASLVIPVEIENEEACPRYSALTISNIKVGESPQWLKDRLQIIGLRPINNVVDATNYVLYEMGHPLHAFDADKIQGQKVRVRTMPEGSIFHTLDEVERKLSAEDLMICDIENPMCIGGVFGGLDSGVTETTTNVFLESAYFNPVYVRKTARRHGLNTDASFRFERGADPDNTIYVLKRCALLIQEVAGGEISSEIIDEYPLPVEPAKLQLSAQKVNSLVGKEISKDKIEQILNALEIKINTIDEDKYELTVPPYRVDVQRDVDVIEEILRIYGYNNVGNDSFIKSTLSYQSKPDSHKLQNIVSDQLSAQGFREILNNSLTKSAYYDNLESFPSAQNVKIVNSLSMDLNVMRQTLLFGGLETIRYNVNRKHADLKLYEFGNTYFFHADKKQNDNALKAYKEEYHLGLWLTGQKYAQSWTQAEQASSVYELKAYVENILAKMGVNKASTKMVELELDYMSDAISIQTYAGRELALYGIVSPSILKKMDIEQAVFYADLRWENILRELKKHQITFSDLSKFPEVKRDLALLVDNDVRFADIENIAYQTERKLLKNVVLFDVYEGKNLEPGKKSYAANFTLQDESKTLTDKQIDAIMQKITQNIEKKLGAKLRQ